jgi:hypothetical protein
MGRSRSGHSRDAGQFAAMRSACGEACGDLVTLGDLIVYRANNVRECVSVRFRQLLPALGAMDLSTWPVPHIIGRKETSRFIQFPLVQRIEDPPNDCLVLYRHGDLLGEMDNLEAAIMVSDAELVNAIRPGTI